MAISLNQHKATITNRIIRKFSDDAPVQLGFSGFFPAQTSIEKTVGIEVERNLQRIAVDVQRCTDPVRNIFSTSVEKIFEPPYFNEAFDFTACQRYDVTFGNNTNPSTSDAINMINQTSKRMQTLRNKILRAAELQRSQVLQTGIVVLKNGDNIDYKRKATSMVALGAGARWNEATGTPLDDLATAGEFLREEGLSTDGTLNAIMGRDAYAAFMSNDQVKANADFRRINKLEIGMPQFDKATGMVFQGQIGTADYTVNLFTYNSFYTDDAGATQKYLDPKNVVILPSDFEGVTAYAGIPAITRDKANAEFSQFISVIESDMYMDNYIDPEKMAHWFRLRSAPLAIPVSIDRIYTLQTLA